MEKHIVWTDVAVRLICTTVGGVIIGFNREEEGRPAGLRTTLMVALAAALAMVQANLLLGTAGKASDSFVVLDLMRLPLGILTGVGFIGAGAILRRENLILGVTTAATLWFVTVMGLCFGGGQIGLGFAALSLGFLTLSSLKWVEHRTKRDWRARFTAVVASRLFDPEDLVKTLKSNGYSPTFLSVNFQPDDSVEFVWNVKWHSKKREQGPPSVLKSLIADSSVVRIQWVTL